MSHGVRFMVIGGYAVIAHGHPRYTGDIDFFVEKSRDNATRLVAAITDFFGSQQNLTPECFLNDDRMSQFGIPPYRIDILVSILGVTFEEAWTERVMMPLAGAEVPFISLEHLKTNKKATGRNKDLGDLDSLEAI